MASEALKLISKQYAKKHNLKHYYTGVKCKNGHTAQRGTKWGKCVDCNKASANAQYKKDPKKCYESTKRNAQKNNWSACRKYKAKKKAEAEQIKMDSIMNITTKVDICVGLLTGDQIDNLVDCSVADYADFTQRKQYNEFRFTGDKNRLFTTSWEKLKAIMRFTVEIGHDGISIT